MSSRKRRFSPGKAFQKARKRFDRARQNLAGLLGLLSPAARPVMQPIPVPGPQWRRVRKFSRRG